MDYLLLFFSVIFAVSNNGLLHNHGGMKEQTQTFMFNAFVSFVWFSGLLMIRNVNLEFSSGAILFGILYGAVQAVFLYFKMQAMANGPVSISTLIGTCSFVLSTVLGMVIWDESITVLQGIGLTFLMCSLMLSVKTNEGSSKKMTFEWLLYCIGFFVASASVGIVFKMFSKSSSGNATDMMIVASLVMTISFLALSKPYSDGKFKISLTGRDIIYATACGTVSCAYNRLNIYLTGALPSIVFFPIFNGGVIFLSLITGLVLFKEKLSKKQIIGFVIGLISLMLAGNVIII
ncbi:MAG: EamA family transporter [Clostridia bacterium]|nr:EamA family transporter [Clostridia bacterium]